MTKFKRDAIEEELVGDDYTRWCNWMLLEHGASIEGELPGIWNEYESNRDEFQSNCFYFGCGYDVKKAKYEGWDLCDIRQNPGVIEWDILMGFPYKDDSLNRVKTKLSLGMFTWHQVRFLFREASRTLEEGGTFDVTFRNLDRLLARREDLTPQLFSRYIYGSGIYYGSRRKSCWCSQWVQQIAMEFRFKEKSAQRMNRGMNTNMFFTKVEGKLKKYGPEPKVHRNEDGTILNAGGDFPSESIT